MQVAVLRPCRVAFHPKFFVSFRLESNYSDIVDNRLARKGPITKDIIMARPKSKTSKSAAVREALASHPGKSAAEIAKDLGVNPALVYNVKSNMKKKSPKAKGKPGRKPGASAKAPQIAHAALDSAFEFVVKVGGLIHAEELIARLKAIKERL
jgi:hypothetical protein